MRSPAISRAVVVLGFDAVRNIAITVNVQGPAAGEPQRLAQTGRQLARAAAGDAMLYPTVPIAYAALNKGLYLVPRVIE